MPNEEEIVALEQTVTEPVTAATLYSAKEFEVDAFSILDTAKDYQTASNDLIKQYSEKKFDDPEFCDGNGTTI
jgi:hypothetical protein